MRTRVVNWVKASYDAISKLEISLGKYGALPGIQLDDESTEEDAPSMYGDHLPKLRAIKKKYDPRNLFKSNHNITPAK
jgi:FAD/FMN-containing dehydrogenase